MKIVYKLIMGFLVISILMGFLVYNGYNGAISIKNQYDRVADETLPVFENQNIIKFSVIQIIHDTQEIIVSEDKIISDKKKQEIVQAKLILEKSFEKYEILVNTFFPDETEILQNIRTNSHDIMGLSSELIYLKEQGNKELEIQEKELELDNREKEFLNIVDIALEQERVELNERTEDVNDTIKRILFSSLLIGFISFVVAISIGLYISRSLHTTISKLKNATHEISNGNLDTKIEINSKDEIEDLSIAFNQMTQDLKTSINEHKIANRQIQKSLQEKEVLLREIHHRVKNNMQIISSLLLLSSQNIEDKKFIEILGDSQNRIHSMALIHEKLYQSENLAQINMNEYINDMASNLFNSYSKGNVKLEQDVEICPLNIDYAIPCGLIINELITNSLKYAFPEGRNGTIKIAFKSIGSNMFQLSISDDGIGIPGDMDIRETKSLGLHLVTSLAENQLHGKLILNRDRGTEFQIVFKGV
ncbi:MAG: HAMP domain-containing protein [Candidatus Methanoperedens sp.]|nr:HAMP domain-containing protein [Candidatus Methanoperedens sp.]CAG1000705.1 two-component system, sensor histidine kinase PdtaS [Methanosarcinales archaeon]